MSKKPESPKTLTEGNKDPNQNRDSFHRKDDFSFEVKEEKINNPWIEDDISGISDDFVSDNLSDPGELDDNDSDSSGKTEEYIRSPSDLSIRNVDNYVFHEDRSYFFIFGPTSVGKTVIIGSIYRYLTTIRGLKGDKLSNINDGKTPHEREGNRLLNQFIERNQNKTFVKGTLLLTTDKPIPRHINFRFTPAHKKKPVFEFCFMDMSGEDLKFIDYDSDEELPPAIKTYVEDVTKENLCFIYVLDPEQYDSKVEQINLFNAFIHMIDANEHDDTPILLLVSKWDLVTNYKDAEDYLKNEYESIWATVNQTGRDFTISEFSIGEVNDDNIDEKIIEKYDPSYPEKVFQWMYETQMGVALDGNGEKSGNWFVNFIKKYLD